MQYMPQFEYKDSAGRRPNCTCGSVTQTPPVDAGGMVGVQGRVGLPDRESVPRTPPLENMNNHKNRGTGRHT